MTENTCDIIKQLTREHNGSFPSYLEGVNVFYLDEPTERKHISYNSSIVIICQGHKVGYLQGKELHYNANNYLVLATPLPFECQSFASKEEPLVGMMVDIDIAVLQEILNKLDQQSLNEGISHASEVELAQASPLSEEMKDTIFRLATQLKDKETAKILGPNTIKELYYQVLKSKHAYALYALADRNSHFTRIANILSFINQNLSDALSIDKMAEMSNMSSPTFHRLFKKVTGDSPIQFIKKARLSKARDLIEHHGMRANVAAQTVGYDSMPQFSREFKRLFGASPKTYLANAM